MNIVSSRQIGQLVRDQRKKKGLTQKQLAQDAEVSERLVSALELGDAPGIQLDKLLKILEATDLNLLVSNNNSRPNTTTGKTTEVPRNTNDQAYAEGFAYMLSILDNLDGNHREDDSLE